MTLDHGRAARMLQALFAACDPSRVVDGGGNTTAYDAVLEEAGHHLAAARDGAQLGQWLTLLLHEEMGSPPDGELVARLAEAAVGWRGSQLEDPRTAVSA